MVEVALIAAQLSEGAQRAILSADQLGALPLHAGYRRDGTRRPIMLPTIRKLQDLSIVTTYPYALTPLGLELKAYLERNA